jgi:hypothetical protein
VPVRMAVATLFGGCRSEFFSAKWTVLHVLQHKTLRRRIAEARGAAGYFALE